MYTLTLSKDYTYFQTKKMYTILSVYNSVGYQLRNIILKTRFSVRYFRLNVAVRWSEFCLELRRSHTWLHALKLYFSTTFLGVFLRTSKKVLGQQAETGHGHNR
jgi:hypothetical protein